jgi:hypothetical protein
MAFIDPRPDRIGEPHSPQKLRATPGEDANSFGLPCVNRSAALGTMMKVVIGDDVWRRQLSQWQCVISVASPEYS